MELPDAYSSIIAYVKSLEENPNIVNYMQCPHWQKKLSKFKAEDVVLPLFLFYDGFQCNNVLGSHAEKFGGVYASLPCLPPECASAIENIFLALVFNTTYRSLFGVCWSARESFVHFLYSALKIFLFSLF